MGVKLTPEEMDEFLTTGHTLIVATIRKSGEPFMMPIWYVWMDGAFWVGTGANSAKVGHIKRDPRVCCMVETGDAWVDLKAVIANCDAVFVEDKAQVAKVNAAIHAKYAPFRMQRAALPEKTQNHYNRARAIIKMTPREGEVRSWYNRKIRMPEPAKG